MISKKFFKKNFYATKSKKTQQDFVGDKRGIWDKKIVTLILVILVVVSVLMFLFRSDINSYLKNLPGFSVPEEDEEIKGHKRKEYVHRDDLAGEHKLSDIGQLILLLSFLILWILDSFVFKFSTFLVLYIPNYVRGILSSFILIIAGLLAYKAHGMVFGEERDEPGVIKEGVFAIVRHPMYLGSILLYLGLFLEVLTFDF